jgi:hypothetical protein
MSLRSKEVEAPPVVALGPDGQSATEAQHPSDSVSVSVRAAPPRRRRSVVDAAAAAAEPVEPPDTLPAGSSSNAMERVRRRHLGVDPAGGGRHGVAAVVGLRRDANMHPGPRGGVRVPPRVRGQRPGDRVGGPAGALPPRPAAIGVEDER